MSITGYCASDDHKRCPDTIKDKEVCDCPCHLNLSGVKYRDPIEVEIDKEAVKFKEAWERLEWERLEGREK